MIIVPTDIKIGQILLDRENPRLSGQSVPRDQEALCQFMLDQSGTRFLLKSLKEGVSWVNRIVVRPLPDGRFVVVEGNTRLACLKSGEVPGHEENTEIPVLVATQEPDESEEKYNEKLRRLQGIANVMIVKDWSPVAKAEHLHKMFLAMKDATPAITNVQAGQSISNQLGMGYEEVSKYIRGYAFYKAIKEEGQPLLERDWSYIEGIDKNDKTRKFFGFDKAALIFEWQIDPDTGGIDEDEADEKRRRLARLPELIRKQPEVTAQEFRKRFTQLVEREDAVEKYEELVEGSTRWAAVFAETGSTENPKDQWMGNVSNMTEKLRQFPTLESWKKDEDFQDRFKQLKDLVDTIAQCVLLN